MAGLPFSDTSARQGLIQDCEDTLNFPATGISGNTPILQQFTRSINQWYYKVETMILASEDSWDFDDGTITTTAPIATRPMVASQRDYSFSTALWNLLGREGASAGSNAAITPFKIKRVDFTYDGTTWYKAELLDTGLLGTGLGNDANTDSQFTRTKPFYDVTNGGISIYPECASADVSAGAKIRVEFTRAITEFAYTDTTKVPGFDASFHRILSVGACYDYAFIKSLPQLPVLADLLKDYETRLKQYYGQKDTDTQFRLSAANTWYQ